MNDIEITQEDDITIVKQNDIEIRYKNYSTEFKAYDLNDQLTTYKLDFILNGNDYKAFGSIDNKRMFSLTDELEFRLYEDNKLAIININKVKLFENDEYVCSMENDFEESYFKEFELKLRNFIEKYMEELDENK